MGRYSSVDWIQFEWNERRTGLGPVRSSLQDTRGWDHQLGPWLDPGPAQGVSICRLVVEGRVVVLARTRSGGSDSRRTIQVLAYVGGAASQETAMPNVRQALALAPGWASLLPGEEEPLDLARLIEPYDQAARALDRQARAGAAALAPIVAECLRTRGGKALSVASDGDAVVQLWGLVDILDRVLGHFPQTFSTYESDDLQPGAEVIFLQGWPGLSSRGSHRARVDLRAPEQSDRYADIAAMVVDAYARDQLLELCRRLRITDGDPPAEERIRRLEVAAYEPETPVAKAAQAEDTWAPLPRQAARAPAPRTPAPRAPAPRTPAPRAPRTASPAPGARPSPAAPATPEPQPEVARPEAAQAGPAQAQAETTQAPPAAQGQRREELTQPVKGYADRGPGAAPPEPWRRADDFELLKAQLAEATTVQQAMITIKEIRSWTATRQPSVIRSHLPDLIRELERLLPEHHINPTLRDLLDPDAPRGTKGGAGRSEWLEPRWLVIAAALALVLVLQLVILFLG